MSATTSSTPAVEALRPWHLLTAAETADILAVSAAVGLAVVVINSLLGFVQESRAENSLESLRQMLARAVSRAEQLEVDESASTVESIPTPKHRHPVSAVDAPLGDLRCLVFMNTLVMRGRGELVVVATESAAAGHDAPPDTEHLTQLFGAGRWSVLVNLSQMSARTKHAYHQAAPARVESLGRQRPPPLGARRGGPPAPRVPLRHDSHPAVRP